MTARIAVEDVTIRRFAKVEGVAQARCILDGVTFDVPAGGRLAIIGPSGAGKTSLLRLLNRLDDPAVGRVLLDGVDVREIDLQALRRRVGMLFQHPFLFDGTVRDNLAYPLTLLNRTLAADDATALLAEVGLAAEFLDRQHDHLSIGQTQRVALARALALEPDVLLLDEPTSALDEESARLIIAALLRRNRERGLTLALVTHTREWLAQLDCPVLLLHASAARLFPDAESALAAIRAAQVAME